MKVLLIEDDTIQAHAIGRLFARAEPVAFDVEHAGLLSRAKKVLSAGGIDAVLLDLALPDSQGLETFREVHAESPHTPVVVYSGAGDESLAQRAVQEGAQDYLVKGRAQGQELLRAVRYSIERGRSQEAIRESEERFRLLVENVQDYALFMVDPDGEIISWNSGAERIQGYSSHEAIGRSVAIFYMPEELERGTPRRDLARAATQGTFRSDGWRLRKDGARFYAEATISALRTTNGTLRGFAQVIRDVTDQRRLCEERIAYQNQLRELAAQLSVSEERERHRIATLLHDDVTQVLAAAEMKLDGLPREALRNCGEAVGDVRELIEQALQHTRSLTFDLSPPILYEVGLEAALESLAARMHRQDGLRVVIEHDPAASVALDPQGRVLVFQVVRELLRNVVKHARVSEARVTLLQTGQRVRTTVSDNGVGFDSAATSSRTGSEGGFGLFSVRERLAQVGSRMEIRSRPGGGTRVAFEVEAG